LRLRLQAIAERLGAAKPDELAAQLGVLVNGAFVSAQLLEASEAESVLVRSMAALAPYAGSPWAGVPGPFGTTM
jgi:hypothetical protein